MLLLTSCSKDFVPKQEEISKDNQIVLGEKLENPYSLINMQKALDNLANREGLKSVSELQPTHLYVRFLPKDSAEYNSLLKDTTLVLFSYPLDYVVSEGVNYHDPSLAENQITWQYTKVPTNYVFPSVEHEVIEELYIPVELEQDTASLKSSQLVSFYDILNESMSITGNLQKDQANDEATLKGLFPKKWWPSASIRAWDDILQETVPLNHVKVRARHLLHWDTGITNDNGIAVFESFRYGVNYSIVWESDLWDIRNGWLVQAYYNGPNHQKSRWNLEISSGLEIGFATIHRAAYKHFYGDNLGMYRPTLKNGAKTKICYIDGEGSGVFWGDWSSEGVFPDIKVWRKNEGGSSKPTNQIFGTTSHELGHQAHSQYLGNIQYWQVSKVVYESWADAVEWALTNDEYHKLGVEYGVVTAQNYNHIYNNHSSWPFVNDKAYSPIFIDLVDNVNQRKKYGSGYPNDDISGYTMEYIYKNILEESFGISSLKESVKKHKITGVSDEQIENLFNLY